MDGGKVKPMTYTEYKTAVSGAEQNYAALFDTEENRTAFLNALRAGGEAIKTLEKCFENCCGGNNDV